MRASTILVAVAIGVAVSSPAYAGKYSCVFFNGASAIQQCDIEAGAPGYYCQKIYNPSITGTCFVSKGGTSDRLQCVYHSASKSIAELARDAEKADTKLASEQPGFLAGGVTLGAPAGLVLVAGYQESSAAPLFQVQCVPK
jgi:hypothetical protein